MHTVMVNFIRELKYCLALKYAPYQTYTGTVHIAHYLDGVILGNVSQKKKIPQLMYYQKNTESK